MKWVLFFLAFYGYHFCLRTLATFELTAAILFEPWLVGQDLEKKK